eukprot:3238832-Alexandrium_andersonii.AAC.1
MSASLVGSEMCIRDRWLGTRAASGCRSLSLRLRALGARWSGSRPVGRTCLLYTSDAADDM